MASKPEWCYQGVVYASMDAVKLGSRYTVSGTTSTGGKVTTVLPVTSPAARAPGVEYKAGFMLHPKSIQFVDDYGNTHTITTRRVPPAWWRKFRASLHASGFQQG